MTTAQRRIKNREYKRAQREREKGIVSENVSIVSTPSAPEVFDLPRQLALAKLEAFHTLLKIMHEGKGIASLTAAIKIREWADEEDDQLEPFEVVDANPFEPKVVQIKEAN